jgi:3-oxoacyl-[acyl-carrier-protein] synthase-1
MSNEGVWIVKTGMLTPVGIGTAQTVTSVRAGISRYTESSVLNKDWEPVTLASVPDDALPPLNPEIDASGLTARQVRMLRLATSAMQEALAGVAQPERIPLFLGAPDALPGRALPISAAFLPLLQKQVGLAFSIAASKVFPYGRAAGMIALHEAAQVVRSGAVQQVLMGGLDTYLDSDLLGTLDMEDRVLAEGVMDGFCPGESACFLLLSAPRATGAIALAKITGTAVGTEPGHRYSDQPYKGDGLAQTFQSALAHSAAGTVKSVYVGFNGENFWTKEWGVAYLRSKDKFAEPFAIEHPADCFGDPGAALGPLMVGIAADNLSKGHIESDCLVWCSSDRAERGAAVLERS